MNNDERKKIYEQVMLDFNIPLNEDGSQNDPGGYWHMWAETWIKFSEAYKKNQNNINVDLELITKKLDDISDKIRTIEKNIEDAKNKGARFYQIGEVRDDIQKLHNSVSEIKNESLYKIDRTVGSTKDMIEWLYDLLYKSREVNIMTVLQKIYQKIFNIKENNLK